MRTLQFALVSLATLAVCTLATAEHRCKQIDDVFIAQTDPNETVACRCFVDPSPAEPSDDIWIGCNGHSMSTVFTALASLNETLVSRLHIWDSILNIIPSEMFDKVRPRVLIIESSTMSVVRKNGFGQIGARLKELRLRNNIVKKIEPQMLQGLDRLQVLDVSGNKLTALRTTELDAVTDLRELILNDNDISSIDDAVFAHMTGLKTLSLAGNKITNITKDTFKGLDNLEFLHLQDNQIVHIDWAAFKHMKQLKHLDLGTNHVTNVELRGLEALQKLILNNNSIQSLKDVSLRDLPSLLMLSLDRNSIAEIEDSDLFGLASSTRIESISMAANNISLISPRALSHVQHISTLALQNNQLSSLSSSSIPYLRPLKRLSTLLLSGNTLTAIREGELPSSLRVIAADHNKLTHVDQQAFAGMPMQRIFLNNNLLAFMPKGTFDSLDMESLDAVDVTSNQWQCVCGEEWLGAWLESVGERDIGDGPLGCLATTQCAQDKEGKSTSSTQWVTITAYVLAAISLVILIAIAFLYIDENRNKILVTRQFGRRIDSDLLKLINDSEPIDAKTDEARGLQTKREKAEKESAQKKSVRFESM